MIGQLSQPHKVRNLKKKQITKDTFRALLEIPVPSFGVFFLTSKALYAHVTFDNHSENLSPAINCS